MDHGLISTINLIIEFKKFLPKNILSIVQKNLVTAQFVLVVTKVWPLKVFSVATRFKVID
jgi:hypothetical protein